MDEIEKTLRAFNVAEDIANVRPRRKERIDGLGELTDVGKGALTSVRSDDAAR